MKRISYKDGFIIDEIKESRITNGTEVKIKINLAGICGTDMEIIAGRKAIDPSLTLGHEAIGTITEKGEDVKAYHIGDRVIINPNQHCGLCDSCKQGDFYLCQGGSDGLSIAGVTCDGVFSEYFVTDQRFVELVDENLDQKQYELMVLTEPMACVLKGISKMNLDKPKKILVIGLGTIGYLAVKVLQQKGHLVYAIDTNEHKIKSLQQELENCFIPVNLPKERFDCILDAVGDQLEFAMEHIIENGEIIIMGLRFDHTYSISPKELVEKNISIIGSSEYTTEMHEAKVYLEKQIKLKGHILKKYSIDQLEEIFSSIDSDPEIKKVLVFDNVPEGAI